MQQKLRFNCNKFTNAPEEVVSNGRGDLNDGHRTRKPAKK